MRVNACKEDLLTMVKLQQKSTHKRLVKFKLNCEYCTALSLLWFPKDFSMHRDLDPNGLGISFALNINNLKQLFWKKVCPKQSHVK